MQTTTKKPPKVKKTPPKYISIIPSTQPPKVKAKVQKYKYTEQFVYQELEGMLTELAAQEQIKTKVELFSTKEYSPSKFSMWKKKYSTSKRIDEKMKKIDSILEHRLIQQGLTGKNFPFVIFLLKNHYGYQDKREVEQETTHVFKVTRGQIQDKGRKVIDLTPPNQTHPK